MRRKHHIKFNRHSAALALFGFLASTGIGVMSSTCAEAASSPTVTATFMEPVGTTTLQPGQHAGSTGNFYVPVKIDTENASALSISVNAKSADLVGTASSTNKITSVPSDGEYTIGQMNNQWGYRWSIDDTIDDTPNSGSNPKNYQQMPTTSTLLDTIGLASINGVVTKYLTLGFGVGVNGTTPADTYTNEVTVSVVATPRTVTIFDITYMQDMTTDICYNTKTPTTKTISTGADINVGPNGESYTDLIDTDGSKQSLPNATDYVPQKELIDKRDGKKYTIRKLADGNCWMVSNLEFDLVPTASKDVAAGTTPQNAFSTSGTDKVTGTQITLTNEDTDLNSITTWTPAIATELYGTAGTVYKTQRNAGPDGMENGSNGTPSIVKATVWTENGSDGLRSFSSAAGYPNALYSIKTTANGYNTSSNGDPWQKFGNLYNWTAATLGSGTILTTDYASAEDSICPRGWKLPYYEGDDSWDNLLNDYGFLDTSISNYVKSSQLSNFPLNFLRSGGYYDDHVSFRSRAGYWWTANRSSTSGYARYLFADNSQYASQAGADYGTGYAIRCVAR